VAGIAVSLQDTVAEARDLAMTDGFPVFGSTITSDDFNNIPDLVRMAPSNQQDIEALLQYVRPSAGEGFLIYDTNPADKYSNNIGQEFVKELGMQDLVADQTYSTAQGQFSQNRIEDAAESICADYNDHPDTVLFGGRSSDLGTLIGDLSVDCPRDHITILTGDDVINISLADNAAIAVGLAHNVSVIYAGEFDPNEWDKRVRVPVKGKNQFASARQGYEKYTAALKLAFGGSATNNDNVALAYDAMLTCVTVIQQDGGSAPQASNLLSYLTAFQADNPIYGSSGPIILSGIYTGKSQQGSNPVGRMIPIMQLLPNGKSKFLRLEQAAVVSPGS
jgi:ABC-type branched-subunit amino acid transport system substrate-binding protein